MTSSLADSRPSGNSRQEARHPRSPWLRPLALDPTIGFGVGGALRDPDGALCYDPRRVPSSAHSVVVPPRRARFQPTPGLVVAEKYRVDAVIGEGGMGIVVAATHLGLDQRVAVKFLLPEAARNADVVERFQREARIAAKVKSEHVARVSDVGAVDDGTPFIVMEHLEGADLSAILKHDGALPVEEACEITLQACEALAEVHAAGIVHRDLKPSNLFVTRRSDGTPCVKLLDFGISKLTDATGDGDDPALTATATIMGSPAYMSPEQLRSTREVDARADVWSLGAVLYEAVTGRGAFQRETVAQVFAMIASEDPAPPSSVREAVPPALERAILGCLVRDAAARSTLVDLARGLVDLAPERARALLARVEATVGAGGAVPRAPSRPRQASQTARAITAREVAARTVPARARPEREKREKRVEREEPGRRGTRGPLLLLIAAGLLGTAIATGQIDLPKLGGRVAGATSLMPRVPAVPPLASVVAPIASAVAPFASAVAPIASAFEDRGAQPAHGEPAASAPPARTPPARHPARSSPGVGKVPHKRH
jgi:tRNA A-37 threonylcarbamoyl transferase component Bud32